MWQVSVVESGSEEKIQKWCAARGHDVYVPMSRRWTKPARKRQPVEVKTPAFPGYMFTKIESSLPELEGVREFYGFLQFGAMQAFVTGAEIDMLRIREETGAFDVKGLNKAGASFDLHEEVRITSGPWQTLTGFIDFKGRDGSLKLTGGDMGRSKVWVPADICEAA